MARPIPETLLPGEGVMTWHRVPGAALPRPSCGTPSGRSTTRRTLTVSETSPLVRACENFVLNAEAEKQAGMGCAALCCLTCGSVTADAVGDAYDWTVRSGLLRDDSAWEPACHGTARPMALGAPLARGRQLATIAVVRTRRGANTPCHSNCGSSARSGTDVGLRFSAGLSAEPASLVENTRWRCSLRIALLDRLGDSTAELQAAKVSCGTG